ncbi:hypothetical protein [Hymenobacter latericus]|uniref:hypothetical protein n=1 Tax=Hymenobacter sp. YIM 151858-1 TaxID=2987688 RepID=UPI0022262DA6|nr:hypothetical protein [Hymenobacter sp. YIM 151858-1]UYZ60010.1 hypothetical protein OIS50_04240 [Hymenobacter sp. YIM 151858-1]
MSFTSKGNERPYKAGLEGPISSIHSTKTGELVAVCNSVVYQLNTSNGKANQIGQLPAKTTFLALDKLHQVWAATETGLLNVSTNKYFAPKESLNRYYKWQPVPDATLLDRNDVLWLGFGQGEWGGNLYAFDTQKQAFIPVSFRDSLACLSPVNSFCQVGSQVYLSGAVAHGTSSGCITRLDGFQAQHVFNSSGDKNYRTVTFGSEEGEYIRALAYNAAEQRCYYYSQNGIFKGSITTDLSKASAWQLVWSPTWPGPAKQHTEASKMDFTSDNKLVLLIRNGALGIWDGQIFQLVP